MTGIIGAIVGAGGGQFLGITNKTVSRNQVAPSTTGTYTVKANGTVVGSPGGVLESWNSSSSSGALYDVRATIVSGSVTGTLNSWLNLASDRAWSVTDSVQDDVAVSASILVEIARAGTGVALDNATITITANALTV